MDSAPSLRVELAFGLPERQWVLNLVLPAGSTVQDALDAARLDRQLPEWSFESGKVGVFGRVCALDRQLKEGDRVEVYRPLKADPKEVRRQLADLERAARRAEQESG